MEVRSLPDTSTHDQQWESNATSFDHDSKALSTQAHAPVTQQFQFHVPHTDIYYAFTDNDKSGVMLPGMTFTIGECTLWLLKQDLAESLLKQAS